jgi:hypothetical protein
MSHRSMSLMAALRASDDTRGVSQHEFMAPLLHAGAMNQAYTKCQQRAEQVIVGTALCEQRQGEMARGNAEGQRQEGGCKISKRGGHTLLHC